MKRPWKIGLLVVLAIVLLFAIVAALASPIAKLVINKNGERLIGRELHAEKVSVNLYNGDVTIRDFHCKEQNEKTDFLTFEQLYIRIAYPQLLFKQVNIRHIHLKNFAGEVLQDKNRLNFSDIIERFATGEDSSAKAKKGRWSVKLDDIRLAHSSIRYIDVNSNKHWEIEDINMSIPGLDFGKNRTEAGLQFTLPTGGNVGVSASYMMDSNILSVKLDLYEVHADVMLPLVQDYINVSGLGARVNGSMQFNADLGNIQNIRASGSLVMQGLCLKDGHRNEVASLDELRAVIERCDLNNNTFVLDSLMLYGLTARYEVHKNWNTLSRLLKSNDGAGSSKGEKSSKGSKPLVWQAKTAVLTGHDISYEDYSMAHNWRYAIKTLRVEGKNVSSNGRNILKMNATLTHNAKMKAEFVGGLNIKKQNTRFSLSLENVNLKDFDAACRNYTGYPIESGVMKLENNMNFVSGQLEGNTKIVIDNAQVGHREKFSKAPYKNLPVRSTVKMLTDSENKVILNAPVQDDATRKNFALGKVLTKSLLKVSFGRMMTTKSKKDKISQEEKDQIEKLLSNEQPLQDQKKEVKKEKKKKESSREKRRKKRMNE